MHAVPANWPCNNDTAATAAAAQKRDHVDDDDNNHIIIYLCVKPTAVIQYYYIVSGRHGSHATTGNYGVHRHAGQALKLGVPRVL